MQKLWITKMWWWAIKYWRNYSQSTPCEKTFILIFTANVLVLASFYIRLNSFEHPINQTMIISTPESVYFFFTFFCFFFFFFHHLLHKTLNKQGIKPVVYITPEVGTPQLMTENILNFEKKMILISIKLSSTACGKAKIQTQFRLLQSRSLIRLYNVCSGIFVQIFSLIPEFISADKD